MICFPPCPLDQFSWLVINLYPLYPFPDQTKCPIMYSFNNVQIMKKMCTLMKNIWKYIYMNNVQNRYPEIRSFSHIYWLFCRILTRQTFTRFPACQQSFFSFLVWAKFWVAPLTSIFAYQYLRIALGFKPRTYWTSKNGKKLPVELL